MLKRYNQFVREFVDNSPSVIDAKMSELKDLVSSVSEDNILYEWENKNDHELVVSFTINDLSIKYDFDIDDLHLTKTAGNTIDFRTAVESIDEGLDMIEKDIQSILGITEKYQGQWDSSIRFEDAQEIVDKITKYSELSEQKMLYESDDLVSELEKNLDIYDSIVVEFVIDSILFTEYPDRFSIQEKNEEIINIGDKVMNKFGTEPRQVLNAFYDAFRVLEKYYDIENIQEGKRGRPRSQRYKGKKIPGKYLTKNPGKMKKEIDTFRGKKEYKKDWDADYASGKGGEGKRVKTKKSAATKAYQRMFGDK